MTRAGGPDPRAVAADHGRLERWTALLIQVLDDGSPEWAQNYVPWAKAQEHRGDCPHAEHKGPITCDRCVWEDYSVKARVAMAFADTEIALALAAAESRADAAEARAEAAERRVGELEAALEPFTRIAHSMDESPDKRLRTTWATPYSHEFTTGDVQRAARALRREQQP